MLNGIKMKLNNILLSLRNITRHLTEKKISILLDYKIILSIIILLNLFSIFPINSISNTSALEYSNDTNLEFTFNPTLNLSISGNLSIDNLTPGSSSDSNVIDVNISTNNVSGYSLSATVGSSNNATTNLTNTSNSNYTFTSLTSDTTNLTDFNPNTWGYSYSVDNGTTWSNYSGLPLYTDTNNTTTLNYKNNPSDDTINFKIGAKASNTQPLGEYTNTINFTAVSNPETHYYIQDFTLSECQNLATNDHFTVYDKRDENDYTVRYINGQCWMTQNLRITGTISSEYSNFDGEDVNISQKDLDQSMGDCSGNDCNSYNVPMIHDSGSAVTGVWYNFAAASAKTITGNANFSDSVEDICPSNWHLPAKDEFSNLLSNVLLFAPIAGGIYNAGTVHYKNLGYWWSSTASTQQASYMNQLSFNSNNNAMDVHVGYAAYDGFYIRCVRSS